MFQAKANNLERIDGYLTTPIISLGLSWPLLFLNRHRTWFRGFPRGVQFYQGQRVGCQKRYARRRLRPAAESHCTALLTVTHASFAMFLGKHPGGGDGFF